MAQLHEWLRSVSRRPRDTSQYSRGARQLRSARSRYLKAKLRTRSPEFHRRLGKWLWPARLIIRRPERVVGHVGKRGFGRGWHARQAVHHLRSISIPENVVAGEVEIRVLLQVFRPIRHTDSVAGALAIFDRILIHRGIDQAQIVNNPAGLGAFPR